MTESRIDALSAAGTSVWLDDLSRDMLDSGELRRLITERGISGVTTNPSIFAASISSSEQYRAALADFLVSAASEVPESASGLPSAADAALALICDDVTAACDELLEIFEASDGRDGRVSIEVDPRLAHDSAATLAQAEQLWKRIARPNLLIKIPATEAGLIAIAQAIGTGISVNATLLFGLPRCRQLVNAYFTGLETARKAGLDLGSITAVASVFVSRFDGRLDPQLDALGTPEAIALRGRAGIANARLASEIFEKSTRSARAQLLFARGARPLRPLWASLGTKDDRLPDTWYLTELAIAGTVCTVPRSTLDAYAEHGEVPNQSATGWREADQLWNALDGLGIDYTETVERLEIEGIERFTAAWDDLLAQVQREFEAAAR